MGDDTCTGFTLIEVLVSLMLLSIMLLGLDAMNLSSLRIAKNTWNSHLARLEAENNREKYAA
jgi:prepilin-type N-terminal cleavage/methylation domain-containing protein